jgi:hypothetical protein
MKKHQLAPHITSVNKYRIAFQVFVQEFLGLSWQCSDMQYTMRVLLFADEFELSEDDRDALMLSRFQRKVK